MPCCRPSNVRFCRTPSCLGDASAMGPPGVTPGYTGIQKKVLPERAVSPNVFTAHHLKLLVPLAHVAMPCLPRLTLSGSPAVRITADSARRATTAVFRRCGMDEAGSEACSDVLISNDLRGNESHGLSKYAA